MVSHVVSNDEVTGSKPVFSTFLLIKTYFILLDIICLGMWWWEKVRQFMAPMGPFLAQRAFLALRDIKFRNFRKSSRYGVRKFIGSTRGKSMMSYSINTVNVSKI